MEKNIERAEMQMVAMANLGVEMLMNHDDQADSERNQQEQEEQQTFYGVEVTFENGERQYVDSFKTKTERTEFLGGIDIAACCIGFGYTKRLFENKFKK